MARVDHAPIAESEDRGRLLQMLADELALLAGRLDHLDEPAAAGHVSMAVDILMKRQANCQTEG